MNPCGPIRPKSISPIPTDRHFPRLPRNLPGVFDRGLVRVRFGNVAKEQWALRTAVNSVATVSTASLQSPNRPRRTSNMLCTAPASVWFRGSAFSSIVLMESLVQTNHTAPLKAANKSGGNGPMDASGGPLSSVEAVWLRRGIAGASPSASREKAAAGGEAFRFSAGRPSRRI